MDDKLLKYIPKPYKPYVADIKKDEKVWNEITNKWNVTVKVTWKVNEDTETRVYQNTSYMYFLLRECGCDFIDSRIED